MGQKKSKRKKKDKKTVRTTKREPDGNLARFMPIIIGLIVVVAAGVIIFLAQKTASVDSRPSPTGDQASSSLSNVPRISPEEVLSRIESQADVIIVDTRAESSYHKAHLPGAISIPLEEVEGRYTELQAGKEIITYCA